MTDDLYRLIFDNTYAFMGLLDVRGKILLVNRPALVFAGVDASHVLEQKAWETPWFSGGLRLWLEGAVLQAAAGALVRRDIEINGADGQILYIDFSLRPLRNERDTIRYLVAEGRDIGGRLLAEAKLEASERRHRLVIDMLTEGVVKQRADGTITMCNAAAERILGLTREQMMGRSSLDPRWRAVHEDGSPFPGGLHPSMVALQTGEMQENVVMGVHKPDGTLTWILINVRPVSYPASSTPYAVVASFADITPLKVAEAKLRHAAMHDALTGLPLRPLFTDRLEHALARIKRDPAYKIAVVFVDLDGFKLINDTLGHAAGDALLRTVSGRLLKCVRPEDTVARLGGDEFVVLLEGFAKVEAALRIVTRFTQTLAFTVESPKRLLPVSASVGVTFPDGRSVAVDVIKHADKAMYYAKAAGKGRYHVTEAKDVDA